LGTGERFGKGRRLGARFGVGGFGRGGNEAVVAGGGMGKGGRDAPASRWCGLVVLALRPRNHGLVSAPRERRRQLTMVSSILALLFHITPSVPAVCSFEYLIQRVF
jgi:hypothetical protein